MLRKFYTNNNPGETIKPITKSIPEPIPNLITKSKVKRIRIVEVGIRDWQMYEKSIIRTRANVFLTSSLIN